LCVCPFKGDTKVGGGGGGVKERRGEVSQVPSRALNWLSSRVKSLTFIYLAGSASVFLYLGKRRKRRRALQY